MKPLLIILFLTTKIISFSQDQDRGCAFWEIFCVSSVNSLGCDPYSYYYPPNLQNTLPFQTMSLYSHKFDMECDGCDTFLIKLIDTNKISFNWEFFPQTTNFKTIEENTPYWYKNDTLLDISDFYFFPSGYCGDVEAHHNLKINTPGFYELRQIGNVVTNLPVFHVYYPKKDSLSESKDSINSNIFIYPNPTKSLININYGEIEEGSVFIYDLSGRLIQSFSLDCTITETTIDISHIAKGSYILNFMSNQSIIYHTKLLKI